MFMDYSTKWPKAFAMPDQKTETLTRLFVEQIVCQHGIPEELLSDWGANFLSSLILEVCPQLSEENEHFWLPPTNRWACGDVQLHDCQVQ